MRYEIGPQNEVYVWNDTQAEPFLYQPQYPGGSPWLDADDAKRWAEYKIAELSDPNAPLAPDNPGEEPQPKPTPEQILEWRIKAALGISIQELKQILS